MNRKHNAQVLALRVRVAVLRAPPPADVDNATEHLKNCVFKISGFPRPKIPKYNRQYIIFFVLQRDVRTFLVSKNNPFSIVFETCSNMLQTENKNYFQMRGKREKCSTVFVKNHEN